MTMMLSLRSVLLLLLLLLALVCDAESLDAEGRALLRFKDGVEADPFVALSNWGGSGLDPCGWFGVECSDDGRVVALNLIDLCLKGTLTPELGKLTHLKSLILSNNSFYGTIPEEIGSLQRLLVLDLGHNNLSGLLPSDLGRILSLKILIVKNATMRRLLQVVNKETVKPHKHSKHNRTSAHAPSPSPMPLTSPSHPPMGPPSPSPSPSPSNISPSPAPEHSFHSDASKPNTSVAIPSSSEGTSPGKKHTVFWPIYTVVAGGISCLIASYAIYIFCRRDSNDVTVMPWSTGLSGQLQKALVTGVPSLRRSELERACEDFSNVIGSLSDGMLYKGTLSSGVEIAVTSTMIASAKDWSDHSEAKFRKKISMLSKVNHKNFMSLLGYSEEEEPFTRMMVFEYAPNGTLFEHLHIREAEHLNWSARLRIAMGIAYCLEHMHQLNPRVVLSNLNSSSIYLTDDFAAMVSDLVFLKYDETEAAAANESSGLSDTPMSDPESIVYKFGIILLELISGRRPFSEDDGLLVLWASSYLKGQRPLRDMVDSTLESFREEDVGALCEVIRPCIDPVPSERPTMAEVVSSLRQITAMPPDGAIPKLSPLWWAELEIMSTS